MSSHDLCNTESNADWDISRENSEAELTGMSESLQQVLTF